MIVTGTQPVTILSGQNVSNLVRTDPGQTIIGIFMPAGWDAANLTIQATANPDSGTPTYNDVYTPSAEYVIGAAANRFIAIPATDLLGISAFRLRSGTAATPVNQSVSRTLTLLMREV